jgi:uncharacterized circularly permuted ATP-grasp superfamily protein
VIQDVIRRYNEGFDDSTAAETHSQLQAALEAADLSFGGRLLCHVLRPQLLSEAEYAAIRAECALLMAALDRAYRALMEDAALRAELALSSLEEAAIGIEPHFASPTPFARLDSFFSHTDGSLKFVEYNAETPAGVGYEDVLAGIFLDLPPVRRLAAQFPVRAIEGTGVVLATLLDLFREAGLSGSPAVAIVDWSNVPTKREHEIMAERFRELGVPAVVGAPDELRYAGGVLLLGDVVVNIIYKRVLAGELLEACGLEHPLVRALRDGAAIMANGFRCKVLHKKAIFAVLSDERFAHLYAPAEQAAIAAHVPWTRRVADRATVFEGREIDLLEWAEGQREQLVLKPNDDYGGRGVVLGWEVDDAAWSAALREGLDAPTVVQARVQTAPEPFPLWDGRRLTIEPRTVDLDPYAYGGQVVHGVLTRLSATGLLNVTAGTGSVAPTLIVDL